MKASLLPLIPLVSAILILGIFYDDMFAPRTISSDYLLTQPSTEKESRD